MLGVVAPWSGRFYSLWDTGPFTYSFSTGLFQNRTGRFRELSKGYARIHIPIISSVSEHQPTMWTSFITDLHFLPAVAPAGLWYTIKVCSKYMSSGNIYGFQDYDSAKIFLVIYAAFSCYFSGVMVRLILTLTPVLCMLGGIAMSVTFDHYLKPDEITTAAREPKPVKAKGEDLRVESSAQKVPAP